MPNAKDIHQAVVDDDNFCLFKRLLMVHNNFMHVSPEVYLLIFLLAFLDLVLAPVYVRQLRSKSCNCVFHMI